MKSKGKVFFKKFMSSETIGLGLGLPVALIYGFVISPVFTVFSSSFGLVMIQYAGIAAAIIIVFLALPTSFLLSRKLSQFIDRFYNNETNNQEIEVYFRKAHNLPMLQGLFLFMRISLGAIVVLIGLSATFKMDFYSITALFMLALNGSFIGAMLAYTYVLVLLRPLLEDIVQKNVLPIQTIMKYKYFGLSLTSRFSLFLILPLFIETITLVLVFIAIANQGLDFSKILFNIIAMSVLNFLIILIIGIAWMKRVVLSLKVIYNSMNSFLSEKGDLTQKFPTTLEDDMSYTGYLFNAILYNTSMMVHDAKVKSNDVAHKIGDIFDPLYQVVASTASAYRAVERIKDKTGQQKNYSQESIQDTKKLKNNIENLRTFALEFSNSLKFLVNNVDTMVEMLLKMKDNSQESLASIESGIRNISSIEGDLNSISNASNKVKITAAEINQIVLVIEDIANRTNILAMNASIEASHVGQYGKGFAIVAKEIKKLADQSREGAKNTTLQIKKLLESIETSSTISNSAVSEIKNNLEVFEKIKVFYKSLNSFLEEQTGIAGNLKGEISGVMSKMQKLLNLIDEQHQSVLNTSENAAKINTTSDEIHKNIDSLQSKLDSLMESVHLSIEVLKETKSVDEELSKKFEQFKVNE